jgi:tetratricopeptide (TPR) repeat protein
MRPTPRIFRTLIFLAACGGSPAPEPAPVAAPSAAAEAEATKPAPKPATEPKAKRPRKREPTFAAQLAAIDRRIAGHTKVAENNSRSGLAWGRVADLYLTRARLSGDYDDYATAEAMVDKGFAVSVSTDLGPHTSNLESGPFMTRARLNYTLHRLDRIDPDFARESRMPTRDGKEIYARDMFAANLAFQRGQYDEAEKLYVSLVDRMPAMSALASLALYRWKAGQFDEADVLYRRALDVYDGNETEPEAWLHLQLGLMDLDRGRYDEALAHYREGEALIVGYWLLEEHIAEILTLQGKTDEAKAMYLAIVERTGNPEFMDALAEIHQAAGETEQAAEWIAKADAKFAAQLERFPEAAYGHALEHYLAHGDDPAKALDMARKNHALRPNTDAKRFLAEALLAAGNTAEAKTIIDQALATPMRSADLHATAAAVYAAAGDTAKAEAQRAAARAINPKIEPS